MNPTQDELQQVIMDMNYYVQLYSDNDLVAIMNRILEELDSRGVGFRIPSLKKNDK